MRALTIAGVLTLAMILATATSAIEKVEDPAEEQVREIAKELRCAVCQNQSVYESNSDLAKDMLKVIRDKVKKGETEQAIRSYFHERYGDYIYLEPTQTGSNLLLWLFPIFGLLIGGGSLWVALRRWRNSAVAAAATAPATQPTLRSERIQKEMDGVDL